jgi:hypothetical protein
MGFLILAYLAVFYAKFGPLFSQDIVQCELYLINIILVLGLVLYAAGQLSNYEPNMPKNMIKMALVWFATGLLWGGMNFWAMIIAGYVCFYLIGLTVDALEYNWPKYKFLLPEQINGRR